MVSIEKLTKEIKRARTHDRATTQADLEAKTVIDQKIADALNQAKFVLEQHGTPSKEQGVYTIEPIPLDVPDGRVNIALIGYRRDPSERFTEVTCTVTDPLKKNAAPLTLFSIKNMEPSWWDQRGVTVEDADFMSQMVAHVYNNTFVPAGQ